jgi:hypothetical protein
MSKELLESPRKSDELTRLEILRAFKKQFAGDGKRNHCPFEEDRVVRYHTRVQEWDVPEIHHEVRAAIKKSLHSLHQGQPSQVVILAGEPGMGKSHLLNFFRSPERSRELGYVFVCNSNHWKVAEFEECLLDWVLEALVRPSPTEPNLLLEKIQDIAFQALSQILTRPGLLKKYMARHKWGLWRRMWSKLFGQQHGRFQTALEKRDDRIFRRLDFASFADYVCERFLQDAGNVFHRYVLKVLLRFLFPEDREWVLHWMRGKQVAPEFLRRFGAVEAVDRHYKVMDAIKIVISLFTPEIGRILTGGSREQPGKVFFFAFDQIEGRQELFDEEADWFKFFAKLSELYNALPNVFVLFTMTLGMRDKLYPKMERQFRERIHRDQKFVLREIPDGEILAIYRKRIQKWLGDDEEVEQTRLLIEDARHQYLPFDQDGILKIGRTRTLRSFFDELDSRFRKYLDEEVVLKDPRFELLVSRNELQSREDEVNAFKYTSGHVDTVTELFNRAGGFFAGAYGLTYHGMEAWQTEDAWPAVRLEFRPIHDQNDWARVFVVRLPFQFNAKLDGCFKLLFKLQTERNFLWLVRPEKIELAWENQKQGQVFARVLSPSTETSLRAILKLLNKREHFRTAAWTQAEQVLLEEFKLTYLGEMLQHVAEALETGPEGK